MVNFFCCYYCYCYLLFVISPPFTFCGGDGDGDDGENENETVSVSVISFSAGYGCYGAYDGGYCCGCDVNYSFLFFFCGHGYDDDYSERWKVISILTLK